MKFKIGKIRLLRINNIESNEYGPANDAIYAEVVVSLDTVPDMGFGFTLRNGDANLPSRLAMLSVLRDAYVHDLRVSIAYNIGAGKKNAYINQVQLTR